jgi:hypothetical protein
LAERGVRRLHNILIFEVDRMDLRSLEEDPIPLGAIGVGKRQILRSGPKWERGGMGIDEAMIMAMMGW